MDYVEVMIHPGVAVRITDLDSEFIYQRSWHVSDAGYAKCYGGYDGATPLRMHRLIMERKLGRKLTRTELVDHVDGNRLNNARENLRLASKSQNSMNSGGHLGTYAGVHFDKSRSRWMAYINVEGKRWYLGRYKSEAEAAWMYDQWAIELHGDFARLNLIYN